MDPVLELSLGLAEKVLIQLIFIFLPVLFEFLLCHSDELLDLVGFNSSKGVSLDVVGFLVSCELVCILSEIDFTKDLVFQIQKF